MEMKSDVM